MNAVGRSLYHSSSAAEASLRLLRSSARPLAGPSWRSRLVSRRIVHRALRRRMLAAQFPFPSVIRESGGSQVSATLILDGFAQPTGILAAKEA